MPPRCRFARSRRSPLPLRAEPFRLFFPLGLLASLLGVSLWPLVYAKWLSFYPGEAHARLMIQGFVGAFAMGFLGTASPKMMASPSFTWPELGVLITGWGGNVLFACGGNIVGADACFLFTWVAFAGMLATRAAFLRETLPPAGFVLVGLGILAAIAGSTLLLIGRLVTLSPFQQQLALLLLYEAFILGPILGIGSFLFPRFFEPPERPPPKTSAWSQQALGAGWMGFLLFLTYGWQASAPSSLPPLLRAALIFLYLNRAIPQWRHGTGTLSTLLQWALLSLVIGIAFSGMSIAFTVAIKHLLFIGGYGLLILTVASRVTWGHAGRIDFADGKRLSLRWILGILLIGAATRMVADFIPAIRVSHHLYAALAWVLAAAIWGGAVLRYVWRPDPADAVE